MLTRTQSRNRQIVLLTLSLLAYAVLHGMRADLEAAWLSQSAPSFLFFPAAFSLIGLLPRCIAGGGGHPVRLRTWIVCTALGILIEEVISPLLNLGSFDGRDVLAMLLGSLVYHLLLLSPKIASRPELGHTHGVSNSPHNIQEDFVTDAFIQSLRDEHPYDIAAQIQYLHTDALRKICRQLPDELTAEVISELPRERQIDLFEAMRINRLSGIISEMFTDDVADVLGAVSSERLRAILTALPTEDASRISELLRYPEDSAGGIMQTEFIAVEEHMTLDEVRTSLRSEEENHLEGAYYIYVVDRIGRLTGVLRMRDILFRPVKQPVSEVMIREVRCVSVHADQEKIAELVQNYHYLAVPVVDDFGKLVGVVTNDDVIDVIQEEATEDMQRLAGISGDEGVGSSWQHSVKRRLPWLYLNLLMAFAAAAVVSLYESTIAQYAVLAVFLPIIAGLGGNTGMQVLTIMVRAMALGEVQENKHMRLLWKEIIVGLVNGLAIGLGVSLICWVWKGNLILGAIVFAAMVVNMMCAAAAGVLVPLALKTLKIDPALASSIIVTTIVDVFGFFCFLSLATAALAVILP